MLRDEPESKKLISHCFKDSHDQDTNAVYRTNKVPEGGPFCPTGLRQLQQLHSIPELSARLRSEWHII